MCPAADLSRSAELAATLRSKRPERVAAAQRPRLGKTAPPELRRGIGVLCGRWCTPGRRSPAG